MGMNVKKSGLGSQRSGEKNKIGSGGQAKNGPGGSQGVSGVGQAFSATMDAERRKYSIEEIKKMIESLETHALVLFKNPTFKLFEQYRDKVKAILKEMSENLYVAVDVVCSVERPGGYSNKAFIVISRVDEELAKLEEEFRKKVDINFLAKHYEIKGMLIDALH